MAKKKKEQFRPSPRMRRFLMAIEVTPSVTVAARVAGISRSAHYRTLERNPLYRAAFEKALQRGWDAFEDEMTRRAQYGVKKLVLYHGHPVKLLTDPNDPDSPVVYAYETEYSDGIGTTQLKAKKPKEYRERVEHEVGDKTLKKFEGTMEDLLMLYRKLTSGDDEK